MESEDVEDEKLKHIDPKMVELIKSEIIESSAPIGKPIIFHKQTP